MFAFFVLFAVEIIIILINTMLIYIRSILFILINCFFFVQCPVRLIVNEILKEGGVEGRVLILMILRCRVNIKKSYLFNTIRSV
jgi:hypothetical protein